MSIYYDQEQDRWVDYDDEDEPETDKLLNVDPKDHEWIYQAQMDIDEALSKLGGGKDE